LIAVGFGIEGFSVEVGFVISLRGVSATVCKKFFIPDSYFTTRNECTVIALVPTFSSQVLIATPPVCSVESIPVAFATTVSPR
jgi:hypothetical protein